METIEQVKEENRIVITVLPESEKKSVPGHLLLTLLAGALTGVILIFSIFWGAELLLKL